MRFGLVVQFVQTQTLEVGGVAREFPAGLTLVIDVRGRVRFVIGADDVQSRKQDMEQMAQRSARTTKSRPARQIEIRMYNVGFGDSFLLRVRTDDGERRILVDCGYHSQGKGKFSDHDLVKQIKADLGGAPLHVVIATHRHQDHISGFGEKDLWADVGGRRSVAAFHGQSGCGS